MTGSGTFGAEPAIEATDRLVGLARAGDVGAFNRLVIEHQDIAYSLALRFLGSPESAEDVTQEAFLRAFRRLDRFRGGRFQSWLLTIVANAARDELRRRRRHPERSIDQARDDPAQTAIDPPDPGPTAEATVEQHELRGALERALGILPEDARMVVLLSDVHGLSYEEIAAATDVPLGTVRSRLSRARARLREILQTEPFMSSLRPRDES